MIRKIRILGQEYSYSSDARDFFCDSPIKQENLSITLDLMKNCIDTIYELVASTYPRVYKPDIYIADAAFSNAFAAPKLGIIVTTGLIWAVAQLIEERYTAELLKKHSILPVLSIGEVQSCIRVYAWRYIMLHELYHLWHGHSFWKAQYYFDKEGSLNRRPIPLSFAEEYEQETVSKLHAADEQNNLTQQAIELDADSSAVCMLINLMMRDADARNVDDKIQYVKEQIALVFGALSTSYCLFSQNAGADFSVLNRLTTTSHPIPALRMYYAEEIANGMLNHYFQDEADLSAVESEWHKIVCDVEPEFKGKVDMGQVFFFTAFTDKAQRHLCAIKQRMKDMYESMTPFVLGNRAPKLSEEELQFSNASVWFANDGTSLRGWVNPATGRTSAIKATIAK